MDTMKILSIHIEKDGVNESVMGTYKFRLYLNKRLIFSSNDYKEIMLRVNSICDACFGALK